MEIEPDWKYCHFCGAKLDDVETTKKDSTDSDEDTLPTPSEFKSLIKEILMERAEYETINKELGEIMEQIDAVKHILQLGVSDKEKVMRQVTHLKERLKELKERKQKLTHYEERILLEELIEKKLELSAKLDDLDQMKKTMDKVVYKEMKKSMEEEYDKVSKDLKEEIKEAKKTLKDLNEELIELKRDFEKLNATYKLGDIDEEEYNIKKTKLTFEITKLDSAIKMLQEMIEKAD